LVAWDWICRVTTGRCFTFPRGFPVVPGVGLLLYCVSSRLPGFAGLTVLFDFATVSTHLCWKGGTRLAECLSLWAGRVDWGPAVLPVAHAPQVVLVWTVFVLVAHFGFGAQSEIGSVSGKTVLVWAMVGVGRQCPGRHSSSARVPVTAVGCLSFWVLSPVWCFGFAPRKLFPCLGYLRVVAGAPQVRSGAGPFGLRGAYREQCEIGFRHFGARICSVSLTLPCSSCAYCPPVAGPPHVRHVFPFRNVLLPLVSVGFGFSAIWRAFLPFVGLCAVLGGDLWRVGHNLCRDR
jgi:hypothetical protein